MDESSNEEDGPGTRMAPEVGCKESSGASRLKNSSPGSSRKLSVKELMTLPSSEASDSSSSEEDGPGTEMASKGSCKDSSVALRLKKSSSPGSARELSVKDLVTLSSSGISDSSSSEEDSPVAPKRKRSSKESSGASQLKKPSSGPARGLLVKGLVTLSSSESSSSEDSPQPSLRSVQANGLGSKPISKANSQLVSSRGFRTKLDHSEIAQKRISSLSKTSKTTKGNSKKLRPNEPVAGEGEIPAEHDRETMATEEGTKKRYVLFVGNIPYTASREDVVGHFEGRGVPVTDVRLATSKDTGQSRGFCFVEFGSPKALQVCTQHTVRNPLPCNHRKQY